MGKKRETLFKEKVIRDLAKLPNLWFCKIQQVGKRGTPDLLLCVDGLFVAIELKKDGNTPLDALQEWNLNCIVQAQGMGLVAYPENWPAMLEVLEGLAGHQGTSIKDTISH